MSSGHTLDSTFGAMYIGAMFTMCLYGITTLQTYLYYLYYPKDDVSLKLLVTSLWVFDTVHVAFMSHTMYWYLVTGFGDVENLQNGVWSLFASMLMNVILAFIVQCFFTKRIYFLCPPKVKWWLPSCTGFIVLAHFCFGLETVGEFFQKKAFVKLQEAKWDAALPFAVAAILSDVVIAAALCTLLNNNRTEYKATNNLINRLILLAINRCVLTSAIAIVEVIVYAVRPNSSYFLAIDFLIGKLYANSLLASLNSRESLRGRGMQENETTEASTSFRMASTPIDPEIRFAESATNVRALDPESGCSQSRTENAEK